MPQTCSDFELQKKQAAEQLLKMSKLASNKPKGFLEGINSPISNINIPDTDTLLILGILLILMGESKDNLLILTLFYILI